MSDYDDTNRGALFKNDKKDKETQPDYKGMINVNGAEFWLSSWIKKSAAGKTYMSVSVTPKEDVGGNSGGGQATQNEAPPVDLDDSVPF